jgi:hypothetical protein
MSSALQTFIAKITESYRRSHLIKITLGNKKNNTSTLKNILIKPLLIKKAPMLSFTYRHNTQDIFKNYDADEAMHQLENLLNNEFNNADAFTQMHNFQLYVTPQNEFRLKTKAATLANEVQNFEHNRSKQVAISADAPYLIPLGITNAKGIVKKDMQHKFKQINHYIEIIDGIIKHNIEGNNVTVADMGSGKGYLTFALYDFLTNNKALKATVTGVELRNDLVIQCNAIAKQCAYHNLKFITGSIQQSPIENVDILIALHACDTATDDAIYHGIKNNAKVIVVAPCCHKQIRKQMAPKNVLSTITQHGILLERQAEMVTDTIRALLLEVHGYKTKVFDFIATEHTPKNVMIAAVKTRSIKIDNETILNKISELKQLFNIQTHYLETLIFNNKTTMASL